MKDFDLTLHINFPVPLAVQPSRKITYNLRQKLLEKLVELKENDIIEKVQGPTTCPPPPHLVIVPKCNGSICVIVDMRVGNQAIKRERHFIPPGEEFVQEMSGICHFSELDLRWGYHQLELNAASQKITTFSTHRGLNRHKRLTLGVTSFQALSGNSWKKSFYELQIA